MSSGIVSDVADNLFEIGQSTVKATGNVLTDVASETIEQITSAPAKTNQTGSTKESQKARDEKKEAKLAADKRRFEEVKADLARYVQRKQELDQKIAQEKEAEAQHESQEKAVEKQKKDSWLSKLINRSQTGTERGRFQE